MIDRISNGYVIDFISFEFINFPKFNMADIYITLGIVVLTVISLIYYDEQDLDMIYSIKSKKKVNI